MTTVALFIFCLSQAGCKEAAVVDQVGDEPLVLNFTACLGETAGGVVSSCRGNLTELAVASGCLVIEVEGQGGLSRVPFRYNGEVSFSADAVVAVRADGRVRASAFFLEGATGDPCRGITEIAQPCEGLCRLRLGAGSGYVRVSEPYAFHGNDAECLTNWAPEFIPDEYCDDLDNDCDAVADEGLRGDEPEPCAVGVGACRRTGNYRCDETGVISCDVEPASPMNELADGVDNDCDGVTDEQVGDACPNEGVEEPCNLAAGLETICAGAVRRCGSGGRWSPCLEPETGQEVIMPEECDGLDNDCDGLRDEDFGGRGSIFSGADCAEGVGECRGTGQWRCAGAMLECDANLPAAGLEACDGLDNDCDGQTDEGMPGEPLREPCFSAEMSLLGVGACRAGFSECVSGVFGECREEILPSEEVCDGAQRDEDCDGRVDESGFNACGVCGPLPIEACDGLDNDCDGLTDEGFDFESPETCGGCDNDCVTAGANADMACVGGSCVIAQCQPGFQDGDRDPTNGCECNGIVLDEPDPDFIDSDCDGLDGALGNAIFVAPFGNDNHSGTIADPVQSLRRAIRLAEAEGLPHVYLAEGDYQIPEFTGVGVERRLFWLGDSVSIFGGYRVEGGVWMRRARTAERYSRLLVSQRGLSIRDLANDVMIDNLVILALDSAAMAPSSSVGVNLVNVGRHLTLRNVLIKSGRGGHGASADRDFFAPADGASGGEGARNAAGPGGSALACAVAGRVASGGGNGGLPGLNGEEGEVAEEQGDPAAGGLFDAVGDEQRNGQPGAPGLAGRSGARGRVDGGIDDEGRWIPSRAGDGQAGRAGNGGGGGAGLLEDRVAECLAGGGGGGGGGCPGPIGLGASGGYGSFGITISGGRVKLNAVDIQTDDAGAGGDGAPGGDGGSGGVGGLGGRYPNNCSRPGLRAGRGGDGGSGGCSGSGGGGSGGPTVGILRMQPPAGVVDDSTVVFVDVNGQALADQEAPLRVSVSRQGEGGRPGQGGAGCGEAAEGGINGLALRIGCCFGSPCGGLNGEGLRCRE